MREIEDSQIEEVIVTDTINKDISHNKKISQISIGPLLGKSIIHIANDMPISQLFQRKNKKRNIK